MPIDTFVVLMQENRSFDHYFGWHSDADAKNAGLSYPDDEGVQHPTHSLAPDFQGCAFGDPNHSWDGARLSTTAASSTASTRRPATTSRSATTRRGDIPFIPSLADASRSMTATSPRCSARPGRTASTSTRRPSGGNKANGQVQDVVAGPRQRRALPLGDDLGPDACPGAERHLLLQRPALHRHLRPPLPLDHQAGRRVLCRRRDREPPEPRLRRPDVPRRGRRARALGRRASARRHPDRPGVHGGHRQRLRLLAAVPDAARCSSTTTSGAGSSTTSRRCSSRTTAPARTWRRASGSPASGSPAWRSRPYARRGHVSHMTVTHESILKLLSYRFGLGYLNKRHRYASNIGRSFDWENPDFDVPTLPSSRCRRSPRPATCRRSLGPEHRRRGGRGRERGREEGGPPHRLAGDARVLRPLRIPDRARRSPTQIFSSPDSTVKRLGKQVAAWGWADDPAPWRSPRGSPSACSAPGPPRRAAASPHVNHVFIVVLENEDAADTFGPDTEIPYLAQTLTSQGAFVPNYYATGHLSLDNYISMVSGQAPNLITQADCPSVPTSSRACRARTASTSARAACTRPACRTSPPSSRATATPGRATCRTWRTRPRREPASCRHPAPQLAGLARRRRPPPISTPPATTRSSISTRSSTSRPARRTTSTSAGWLRTCLGVDHSGLRLHHARPLQRRARHALRRRRPGRHGPGEQVPPEPDPPDHGLARPTGTAA